MRRHFALPPPAPCGSTRRKRRSGGGQCSSGSRGGAEAKAQLIELLKYRVEMILRRYRYNRVNSAAILLGKSMGLMATHS
jgi:hypothetical protein